MANSNWVCFDCRVAVRRQSQYRDAVPCPECGAECWRLGYKVPVPPRRDVRAWQELRSAQRSQHQADHDAARAAEVRARHDLEREIRRLEALPADPGRAKAVRLLRRRLGDR